MVIPDNMSMLGCEESPLKNISHGDTLSSIACDYNKVFDKITLENDKNCCVASVPGALPCPHPYCFINKMANGLFTFWFV